METSERGRSSDTTSVLEREFPGRDKRTLIMGILNVTPDSFSDGGRYIDPASAVERAKQMLEEGADILDIGGESTRPGFAPVPLEEELRRVLPAIRAIREAGIKVPISIDTYKAETARQALEAGATWLNDIWGLQRDEAMARVAAEYAAPIVLMHNRTEPVYANFIQDVVDDLQRTVERARAAGIAEEQIILDPGIGFAKTYEQNLQLMNHLERIVGLGFPVLLGTSRKRMIHQTLQLPPHDVVEGTAATVALGVAQGCRIMRVHDVRAMRRVADMTDAIIRQR
ncbi:dihydropteroate synthase [Paenibacillus mucilaginosus]|uniref:Dihydropteroate synthase n=2 Tax=Paenibacillus mucilaginosus TaxID=61624 RepID=H6NSD9_9BACL|nr:dihydropteroate synthase [Paenibacillus mucilaginosus]AEI46057.1 dihydropteroate synthase [Paenibacillus mucilaginosus KNP414]AFC33689.1 dihydropteroate synthase [Paenibacillus mucilaginosus 3016]MCG7217897.1 dihydropteroate synthase [Paenibacillus mucilaginosus]WDM27403.1 dihydropteroate synthase [Paenibacillus mucilaginosus]WFA22092.1 dihydropteroate synthase [Paenibacillus mucilaginosus]